jgi:hypothetical protein
MTQHFLEGTPLEVCGRGSVLKHSIVILLRTRAAIRAAEQVRDHHLESGDVLRLSILTAWKRTIRQRSEVKVGPRAEGWTSRE